MVAHGRAQGWVHEELQRRAGDPGEREDEAELGVAPAYTMLKDPSSLTAAAKPYDVWIPSDVQWMPMFNTSVAVPATNTAGWGQVSPLIHQVPTFVKSGSMIPMLPAHLAIECLVLFQSFS